MRLSNPTQKDRGSKPFISPQRVINPNKSVQNLYIISRSPSHALCDAPGGRSVNTRESARKLLFEDHEPLKTEENSVSNQIISPSGQKKQIVILKKFLSKSPENNIPVAAGDRHANFSNAMKFFEQFVAPLAKIKKKILLHEMITLKKIKTTQSNGILKRMLHVPSLNTYDLQVGSIN